jgi:hypothetical protein
MILAAPPPGENVAPVNVNSKWPIDDGVGTDILYERDPTTGLGKEPRESRETSRRLVLDRLDRDPWETPIPCVLNYRDIEQTITRKKRRRE